MDHTVWRSGNPLSQPTCPRSDTDFRNRSMEGTWSLLRSWLRPHRGISQAKLPLYLAFFEFVHNARRRGKALLGALVAALVV